MAEESKKHIGRIFHVDDNKLILEDVAENLADDDIYKVVLTARSVREALSYIPARLKELDVNFALLDGELPDGSGAEVAEAIRKSELGIIVASLSGKLRLPTWGDINIDKTDGPEGYLTALDETLRPNNQS